MLIQACLNGGTSRAEHPRVPQTPDELAADASAAAGAGARAFHLHPRDSSGAETLDPGAVLAAVAAVRAAAPGLCVGVTTGLWAAAGDPSRRMALVSRWGGADKPDFASVNLNEPGAAELAALLASLGIAVEAGIASADEADRLAASGFVDQVLRILIEPEDSDPQAAVASAARIEAALNRHGCTAPRLHHGENLATWPVLRAAISQGQDIRIGLEDTVVLADGRPASGNTELVRAAAQMTAKI